MNQTETYEGRTLRFVRSFGEIFQDLSPGWILMPFLAALGAVSIPKAISTSTQNPVPRRLLGNKIPVKNFDPSQEILTLGLANLFGAFFKSFPVAISFSRSVIAHTSGVKTQFNNIITGIIVLLALMPVVSPAFHYIPITTLSSVIICAVILIIKPKDVVIAYRTNFVDFLLYLITFILTLTAGLAAGVLVGLILNLIILLTKITRPYVETKFARTPTEEGEQQFGFPYAIIKPSQSIHFPAIDYFSSRIVDSFPDLSELESIYVPTEEEEKRSDTKLVVVIDGEHLFQYDSTFIVSLRIFVLTLKNRGIKVVFHRFRKPIRKPLQEHFSSFGLMFNHSKTEDEMFAAINAAFGFPLPLKGRHSSFTQTNV
ncbi:sodium-independent sulfate anion transporter-like protein [Dinothrombium tinctorium]|uniref:Sodium-independent sulfate anion transporter-like protein n=1 Tax=Dinothrombium tinctorium TaxID=1965070 RepID=A0A3S3NHJ2_9ACAR|nr:sodium-independent sulfate anion transporter-like protein [Dinothrombium tinctorium]